VYYSDHEAVKVTVRFWQVVSLKILRCSITPVVSIPFRHITQ
jgi:hypothetical protein